MERLKRSFRNSFRRKKSNAHQTESSKPHQWGDDEIAVRNGNCSFPVKYLGCVQVLDSRGMHICEQALLTLKAQKKGKSIKGQLYISGDGLRVVDDETKGLIVDQTIEKVSFCAPDRNHDRGFSYICRDGTTRRWMCHGFLATKDTGDRLSHAVGCSFAVCLERKQKRDAKLNDPKTVNNNSSMNSVGGSINNSSMNSEMNADSSNKQFTRTGSFRRIPIKQRMKDPQECKLIEPLPIKEVRNPYAIERPHATPQLLERQGSCRIFKGLNHQNSPFKRQLSLRYSTPSQQEKHQRKNSLQTQDSMFNKYTDSSINNFSLNSNDQSANDFSILNGDKDNDITNMCKNISENLNILSNNMRDNDSDTKNKLDLFEDNFQFNNSKSPVITTAKTSSIASVSKTPTPDYLTNSANKTIINVDSNSLFKKTSSINDQNERTKFGQLSSYLDESFFKDSLKEQSTAIKSNGIIFTDLDEPFEVNFEKANSTKVDVSDQLSNNKSSLNNSSINSLSNSLTSSLNDTSIKEFNRSNNLKMMNKINLMTNDYLIKELNNVNKINANALNNGNANQSTLTNNNNIMNKKLNDKDLFDPFNSDWVSTLSKNELDLNKSTNPFLQSNMGSVNTFNKTFELKM